MNEEQASSLSYLKQKRPQNLQAFKLVHLRTQTHRAFAGAQSF
jgi:hypothetical protein